MSVTPCRSWKVLITGMIVWVSVKLTLGRSSLSTIALPQESGYASTSTGDRRWLIGGQASFLSIGGAVMTVPTMRRPEPELLT